VNNVPDGAEAQREVERLMATQYAIHYHVWTQIEMLELILLRKAADRALAPTRAMEAAGQTLPIPGQAPEVS
jgi:hypothetical protein